MENIPVVDVPFKRVAVDLIGPIEPASEAGHRYILTLVDYATRYPEAVPLRRIDTETVAEALVDIYSRLGVPEEILSDQGTQFISDCMREVCRLLGVTQSTTTPYHPMCNGLVEKFNGTLKKMLKRLCNEKPKQWHRYINALLFAYREVPQESTHFAPFELMYLRERLTDTLELAKKQLESSQARQKKHFDKKTKSRCFRPGDKVLVLLPTDTNKLLVQWKGPYDIIKSVGLNDYKVKINGKEKTLHANLLKRYLSRNDETCSTVLDVSSHIRDDLNVPSCVAVVEDYDYDADNDQNNPADDEQGSEDLPKIGTWGQKEDAADVKFGEALTYDQNQEIQMLVEKLSDIFSDRPGDTNLEEHRIDLTSEVPVRQTPYAVPFALRSSLKKELQQMEDLGIIRKSNSPYASPVVVVKKKDGSNRICIDFRRLNSITVTDPQPVPSPAESFLGMSEDKYFSKLDLTKGYHQIRVRPSDVHNTAFVTMGQHYEFLRMPFGMVNSGMTMTRAVRRLLEGMDNVVDYIDDLLVHTKTWEEHLQVLEELFKRLKAANLVARPTKCELGATQVDFLGHCLGRGTVGLQDCNVEKVKDAPRPTTKKEIRSFLGLVGYYQPFIPNFAAIAAPLSDLTRKGQPNKIVWGEPQERAYATLKKAVISKPILVLPDVNKEFVLRTDASDIGLGATLLQNRDGHIFPVAYASRKLLDREKKYSVMERECLGIVWGIKKFAL
ncbi:hypothetical protein EGW08_020129 [Elysia chlorotica]|uniref:Integrase catalytic domain-containing protein n=1 Tax=Elysia chlorotica TaxID=188477 RepID=A0A433SS50_ELYCH|nr:hypothetical protein EGW08_020129 [Elysia chlorotica]